MDGSVDKNNELRSSLLYFVDEAIGYRHSLHFLRCWLETGAQSELEGLILEVGRENFVDLQPLIDTAKDSANTSGISTLQNFIHINGIYRYENPSVKITPMPNLDNSIPQYVEGNSWVMHTWVETNTHKNLTPYYSIAKAYGLFQEARDDFNKIFDLLELMFGRNTTLFSAVKDNDIELLGKLVSNYYYPSCNKHINRLALILKTQPDLNWKDALSRNQIKSKLWLIDKMNELGVLPNRTSNMFNSHTNVLLVGGWVGILPFLADMKGKFLDTVTNIDIDETVHSAAASLNSVTDSKFKNNNKDVRTLNIDKYTKPIVIDTIVEHIADHGEWVKTLPTTATVVLQGNDMFDVPDHVNCHRTLEDFIESCGLNNIIWSGELNLYKCTRYMAIGTT
jgi:hypothetical protein